MGVSKFFSGLNQNALKFLVPKWMSPTSGVTLRLCFGAIAFWIIGFFTRKHAAKSTRKQKLMLIGIGMVMMFGYMFGLLGGLKYTTPITSSIFISLQPATVFVLSAIFMHDKVTWAKVVGIVLGLGGALIIILTQKASGVASNPGLGIALCGFATLAYSGYLILSKIFIMKTDYITVSKFTFTGGAISSIIAIAITGWHAPVLTPPFGIAFCVLLFVLFVPSVLCYYLVDVGLKYLKATIVALYGNLILVVSTITSYILGQDIFSWWQIVAIVLMFFSVYMVEVAESKK